MWGAYSQNVTKIMKYEKNMAYSKMYNVWGSNYNITSANDLIV